MIVNKQESWACAFKKIEGDQHEQGQQAASTQPAMHTKHKVHSI